MAGFGTAFAVLTKNSADIEKISEIFGGLHSFLEAAPYIMNIVRTLRASSDDIEDVPQTIKRVAFYNDNTKDKVKAFQRANGLLADGLVGDATWAKVEILQQKLATLLAESKHA